MKTTIYQGVLALLFAVACGMPSWGADVFLSSNSQVQGAQATVTSTSASPYLNLTSVDPSVNRLRIVDGIGRVFYDDRPGPYTSIYLPAGSYRAFVWSGYGSDRSTAITGDFAAAPRQAPLKESESPKQAQTQSTQAPYSYYDSAPYGIYSSGYYYNNYPYYYYNNNPTLTTSTVTTATRPASILDPSNSQRSIFNSSPAPSVFTQPARSIFDH
ncbi:MAG: hypothetical protein RDV48_07430 [Candidatus Eremiobacteraeota bacterium]|nr:hypothetical protein [Candidatus Eremiobacteraeota bacterium]